MNRELRAKWIFWKLYRGIEQYQVQDRVPTDSGLKYNWKKEKP
jgi:hypothetical protein